MDRNKTKMNKNLLFVLAFLLFNIGYGQTLKTWTGAASNEWDEDLNWAPIGKPTYFDNVIITNATNQPVISSLGIACYTLELKNSTPGTSVVLTVESGDFSSGSITMTSIGDTSNCSLNIDSGAVTVTGSVTMGNALQNDVTFSGAGSLSIGETITGGALNAGKGTVDYNGTATHTVGPYIYNNLTLSGSGIRTISSGVTVNGTLVMAGSATASAAPIYGANAALKYNTTSSLTTGPEWVTPFIAKKGIQIANKGVITIGNNIEKRFDDGVPLIIDDGASLKVGKDSDMYFGGDFKNNKGSLITDGYIYLTGQKNQQIGSFTSSVGVVMNKTAGIATLITSIDTKELKIDGEGGTLNLGTGLTHTFTDWVRTEGTLNGGASILKIAGNVVGNGGSFNAGTGTVEFNGGTQNLGTGSIIYNNLTLSGTATKTFGAKTTINGTFSILSGVVADLTANLVHSAKYIKLGTTTEGGGSWGSSKSNAVNKNDTYFILNNGIVNVGPTIVVNTTNLAALSTIYGTPSTSDILTLSGIDIVGGILATAPTGFEISSDGTTFSDTISIGTAAYIPSTKVYVRLKGTDVVGSYSGNLVLTSAGTTTINIPIATSTVNKAPLKITADKVSRTYGEANPTFTATYVGIIDGETDVNLTKSVKFSTTATTTSSIGDYPITVSGVTSLNYDIEFVPGTLTINVAPLTITADNFSRTYGKANPTFTATYVGIIDGETDVNLIKSVKFSTAATATSSVGDYEITVSGVTSSNYDIKFVPGKLTINMATLIITADTTKKTHGEENPIFTASYVGIIDGETDTNLTKSVKFNTTATTESAIGEYPITVSGVTSLNYDIKFVAGILEVVASNNADLSDIVVSDGALDKLFTPTDLGYTVVVKNEVDSYVIDPKPSNPNATVVMTIDGKVIDPAAPFDLKVGENVIKIEVLAEDGITRNDYEVIVIREPSTDAGLADLTVSEGTLSPAFDVDNKGYTVDVPNNTTSIVVTPTAKDPDAKVEMRIDGKTIDPTAPIDLKVGDNVVTVVVTAPDGTTQETYEVIVTREPSSDAGLADLTVSEGTLSPAFDTNTKGYTVDVPNATDSIIVTPTAKDPNAKVEMIIDGKTITDNTAPIDLKVGDNVVTVVITAPDGTTQETYEVIVTREPSSNAGLTDIVISDGKLSPFFNTDIDGYTVIVPNKIDSYVVNPIPVDPNATIEMKVDGKVIDPTAPFDLKVGDNVVTIVVTAQDGITQETYEVIVIREAAPVSDNAGLADIVISDGKLSPFFNTDIDGYTVIVPNKIDSYVVNPIPVDPAANIEMKVDGKVIDPTAPFDLKVGDNVVTIVVTAEDGITQEAYEVIVIREAAPVSDNAGLADIVISDGKLSPFFNTDIDGYTVIVPNEINSYVINPIPVDPNATIEMKVDGKVIDPTAPFDLKVGDNVVTIVVTAADGITKETYEVIVIREAAPVSDNAGLADIVISDGILDKPFNTNSYDYRVDVPYETNSYVVNPVTIDPNASVEMKVDGKVIDPKSPIDLKVGDNVITIVVTAADGLTIETYTVIVNRADATPQAIKPANIITPNGDGKNDFWIVDGLDKYPNNSVKVFDRAARLVYSKNNYNNDFDGSYKGSPLNEDTYYYLIDLGNGSPKIKGFISIIRN